MTLEKEINKRSSEILIRQRHLDMSLFSALIMVITTIQWITLDMYLPALPVLKGEFHTTEAMLNISVNAGLVAVAVGTLFSGTVSDRFGRKPVFLAGIAVSAVCNILCAFSQGVIFLSVMRGAAGLGTGAILTVTSAMLKDSFTGRRFEKVMTLLQSIAAVGPLFAPTLGAVFIDLSSWQLIFYFLGGMTLLTGLPMLFYTETWPREKRQGSSMGDVLREAGQIAKAPAFSLFLGIAALLTIPVWAYISVSSYVYINEFGISNVLYGILYGCGAGMSILGPFLYILLVRRFTGSIVTSITIIICIAGGLMLLLIGRLHPVLFLCSIVPIMFAEGMIRPLSLVVLLEEYSHAAGSASALINFIVNLVGIIGTTLATLSWNSMVTGAGIITLVCGVLALGLWFLMRRKTILRQRLDY